MDRSMGAKRGSVRPRQTPGLVQRVEAHVESLHSLGFDVGEGMEVIQFLAELRDMATAEALLHGMAMTPEEREWVMNRIEERMGDLPKPETRKKRFWW
ncbi:MAG TPA: hypothetical protein VGB15_20430 [Longimicrobium sp.]|jgi:hypothetical protein